MPDPSSLEQQAQKCRRLAATASDEKTARTLRMMADDYEAEAKRIREPGSEEPVPNPVPPSPAS